MEEIPRFLKLFKKEMLAKISVEEAQIVWDENRDVNCLKAEQ